MLLEPRGNRCELLLGLCAVTPSLSRAIPHSKRLLRFAGSKVDITTGAVRSGSQTSTLRPSRSARSKNVCGMTPMISKPTPLSRTTRPSTERSAPNTRSHMPWLSMISRVPADISSDVNDLPNAGLVPRMSKYGPSTKFGCTLAGPSVVSSAAAVKSVWAAMLSKEPAPRRTSSKSGYEKLARSACERPGYDA